MWRKCLALLSGFALEKPFIIQVNSSVQARVSTPFECFLSDNELDLKRIFSMWIRGCKKQMNSLKVKNRAWSAGGELERCERGGESARLVHSLDVCLFYVIILLRVVSASRILSNLF